MLELKLFLKMIDKGRLSTAESFLSSRGGILSGPIDVFEGRLLSLSKIISGSNEQEESSDAVKGLLRF